LLPKARGEWPSCFTASGSTCLWTIWLTRNRLARPVRLRSNPIQLNPT
jgi:hypothetical protein